jgi:hypothetical protein
VLEPEPASGATEPRLHLVDEQQRLALRAQLSDRLQVCRWRGDDTAFTLHRFQHHCADTLVHRRGQRLDVEVRDLAEAIGQRLERLLLLRLAGRGQGGERAAVERAIGRDNVEALGAAVGLAVTARELDGALVRLGPGVGEEHPTATAEQAVEARAELRLYLVVIEVGHVQQLAALVGERVSNPGMGMAERHDRQPAEEVEVATSLGVPELCPLTADERDG